MDLSTQDLTLATKLPQMSEGKKGGSWRLEGTDALCSRTPTLSRYHPRICLSLHPVNYRKNKGRKGGAGWAACHLGDGDSDQYYDQRGLFKVVFSLNLKLYW